MDLTLSEKLFLPNNHSDPLICFRAVSQETLAALRPVLEAYSCSDATLIEELDRQQLNSRNFRATTNSQQILIRQSLSPHSPERARLESKVMTHCLKSGVPTPEPLRTCSDSDCYSATDAHGRTAYFTAATFIAGDHYQGSAEELDSAAHSVAELGRALATFPGVQEISAIFTFLTANYSLGLLESLRRLSTDNSELAVLLQDHTTLIADAVSEVQSRLPVTQLESQLLHGDLHPHNFLMAHGRVTAILDFGEMRFGPRLEDVAYALYRLVRQAVVHNRSTPSQNLSRLVTQLKERFLQEHARFLAISPEEQDLIAPMIKHIALKKIFHVLSSHYLHGIDRWNGDFVKHLTALYEADYFA